MQLNVSFSGSGFLFPMHIGSLRALQETSHEIVGYSGTSGGSIIACLAALGVDADTMIEISQELEFNKLLKFDAMALLRSSFCLGKEIEKWLKFLIDPELTFSSLKKDLHIVATDINANQGIIFSKESTPNMPLWLAVRASISIPFVFTPVHYEGRVLMDGFMYNNIPISVFDKSPHKTIGFQITSDTTQNFFRSVRWVPDIAMRIVSMIINNMDRLHVQISELNELSHMVFMDKGDYSAMDTKLNDNDVATLHNMGYKAAREKAIPLLR